jgi:AcrR family transcriptional regulator
LSILIIVMKTSREKILASATDLFLEQGSEALSVRAIAARAGTSTIGIYTHFEGKQGILDALCIEGFERLGHAVETAMTSDDPMQNIIAVTGRYLDVAENYQAHYKLMFESSTAGYQPSPLARAASANAFGKLRDQVARMDGLSAPPFKVAMELWALVHGFVALRDMSPPLERHEWCGLVTDAVTAHLSARLQAL